ncbi:MULTISPECIES: putative peptide modification system cyclase [unclassified Stenotrophomonas]|uniref:putative peptide modification system cyclase n=1 Tax=unclassified Stenotrophomonas TaxID=196198 RepID=UPI002118E407|nr:MULTISPECIES: putative peptide modification system cyclase [unclassified Stenotrophomonas]
MNGDNGTSTQAPQMRALLFTDLCDSLILVERIGDAAAAELFQQHDRLVLTLQQQWNGQQIDRSDGLFLLFDRAIDALGFALDYQHNLQRLGDQCGIPIRARAGLHVGEVILWNNSAEAVAFGAKAVEVEGLAKPMAARLMQLARPGQILVSSTAESMVRRLVDRLGETGNGLKWKSFGRWRFKGVPQPLEVFGVHGPSLPPLQRPRASSKAMRDIPLWRRPIAMAAQATLIVTTILTIWLIARPEPAIAFAERDWVVLADIENATGNPLLNDGLGQAFRISLEQSRYVNVLSDLKTRDTMGRMMRAPGSIIDRAAAVQIASRDGARAVLVPSVREIHGKLRVSIDVIDPVSKKSVYSVYADGRGYSSALSSTDEVVAQLRGRLGEALSDVQRASNPLPEVATANLDALNAYAKGQAMYGDDQVRESRKYFEIATNIDPEFAMAWLAQMRVLVSLGKRDEARDILAKVDRLRSRLTTREQLYLDAWKLDLLSNNESASLDAWATMENLYPDHHGARVNHAWAAFLLGRYAEAESAVAAADVQQNPLRPVTLHLLGRIQLAQGKLNAALATQRRALTMSNGETNRHMVAAIAASGDVEKASKMLAAIPGPGPAQWLEGVSLDLDRGDTEAAAAAAVEAAANCKDSASVCEFLSVVAVVTQAASGMCASRVRVEKTFGSLLALAGDPSADDRGQRLFFAASMMYAAQRMGLGDAFARHTPQMQTLSSEIGDAKTTELLAVVKANQQRMAGDPAGAARQLKVLINGNELFQAHSVLASALRDAGDTQGEAAQQEWLRSQRGLAYGEVAGSAVLRSLNVRDSVAYPPRSGCPVAKAAPGREPRITGRPQRSNAAR